MWRITMHTIVQTYQIGHIAPITSQRPGHNQLIVTKNEKTAREMAIRHSHHALDNPLIRV